MIVVKMPYFVIDEICRNQILPVDTIKRNKDNPYFPTIEVVVGFFYCKKSGKEKNEQTCKSEF